MQALHFTYGLGSFVAPLICEPFLSSESIHTGAHGAPLPSSESLVSSDSSPAHTHLTLTSTPSSVPPSTTMMSMLAMESLVSGSASSIFNESLFNGSSADMALDGVLPSIDPIDFLIYIPYAIAGTITVISSAVVLVLYYYRPYEPPTKKKAVSAINDGLSIKCVENGKLTNLKKFGNFC